MEALAARAYNRSRCRSEVNKEIELEIAYVLFIDIVGYSKLVTHEQRRLLELLNRIVREAEHFRVAEANGPPHHRADRRWYGAGLLQLRRKRRWNVRWRSVVPRGNTRSSSYGWECTADRSAAWWM